MRQVDLQFKEKYNSDWYLDYKIDYYTYVRCYCFCVAQRGHKMWLLTPR